MVSIMVSLTGYTSILFGTIIAFALSSKNIKGIIKACLRKYEVFLFDLTNQCNILQF